MTEADNSAPPANVEPAPAEPVAAPSALDIEIEAWWVDSICNSVASRDTPTVNHLRAKLDELKTRLKAL